MLVFTPHWIEGNSPFNDNMVFMLSFIGSSFPIFLTISCNYVLAHASCNFPMGTQIFYGCPDCF